MTLRRPAAPLRRVLAGLVLPVVVGIALEVAARSGWVSPFLLPPPSRVIAAIPGLFLHEGLIGLFALSGGITLLASLIAVLIGIPAGFLLYLRRDLGAAYESWLGAVFSAPIILLYPLFLVILGRGLQTLVVMGVLVGVTPVLLSTYRGLQGVPAVYLRVARSFNMPRREIWWKVLAPAAMPSIFTGIRLTLIYTMINTIAMEFLIAIGGLGFLVGNLYDRYRIPDMYAAVGFVVLARILFFALIDRVERWSTRA